ncbi:mitogen-activated protein kinase kinase 9-like [Musa acuminata AAA Group]|uniref:mitogen-activated protein kinase kinase n=1 Tax=Musa acuminata subsp. malaccensis TaxID=214687 RepID=A0A804K875_MUSAM|nr:PREDICTED: mitogen-activated protein kinase kinase 9-like [Musa acuminata subsp. malaccensis]
MAVVRDRRLPHLNLTLELPDTGATADCRLRFALPPLLPPCSMSSAFSSASASASAATPPSAEFRFSDFEKIRVLGHGNGGTVYKVRHRRTAALYALKVVNTDAADVSLRRQVYREVDILRRAVDSDHVIRFHAVVPTSSGDVALLLEHMDGGSLDVLLRRRGRPFPEPALAAIARQALLGLAELHSRQIVHRDIKPANLLINAAGEVKIADFGVGKVLRRSLDPCDSYVGTCAYMSPERFDPVSHGGDYDPYAADVWSLGLAVLELHRGHFPLLPEGARPDWAALMVAICFGEAACAVPEGAASGEFRGFIECCLQKESGKRWSVAELLGHPFVAGADRVDSERALRDLLLEGSDES